MIDKKNYKWWIRILEIIWLCANKWSLARLKLMFATNYSLTGYTYKLGLSLNTSPGLINHKTRPHQTMVYAPLYSFAYFSTTFFSKIFYYILFQVNKFLIFFILFLRVLRYFILDVCHVVPIYEQKELNSLLQKESKIDSQVLFKSLPVTKQSRLKQSPFNKYWQRGFKLCRRGLKYADCIPYSGLGPRSELSKVWHSTTSGGKALVQKFFRE